MLLSKNTKLKTAIIAGVTALSVAFTAMPAMALGKKEKGFIAGVGAAILVDQLLKYEGRRGAAAAPRYVETPRYVEPNRFVEPRRASVSVHSTPAAQAFRSYSVAERKAIQRQLRRAGYYGGSIDGVFGSGTYNAIAGYARDSGATRNLQSTGGAFALYDGLLF